MPFRKDSARFVEVLPFHPGYGKLLDSCERTAFIIRCLSVYSMTCGSLGHPGGSLSEAEFLAVLYEYALRFDPGDPEWDKRDVFYLSKCHACPSLYSTLALFGYFPIEWLKTYGTWGSRLESHPDRTRTPGIEVSGGSLGQIPGVALGRAMGMMEKGPDNFNRMVYCLVGDGECDEGSVWEAFLAAGHYGVDNLVFVIDYNKVQAKGMVKDEMSLEPLHDKFKAFNMDVWEVRNGHDVSEIVKTFNLIRTNRRGRPHAVILNTVKGNKVDVCCVNPNWHTSAPRSVAQAESWLREMWERDGRRLGIPSGFIDELVADIVISGPVHAVEDAAKDSQA